MKIAYSISGFGNDALGDAIRRLAQMGFDGVEIQADSAQLTTEAKQQIRQALEETGLVVSNIHAFPQRAAQDENRPSWIDPEKRRREQCIQHAIQCLEWAADLGAKTISTLTGAPVNNMPPELAVDFFVQGIDQVVPAARQAGIKILVEPGPEQIIRTSAQFLSFIGEVDETVVGMDYDIGHAYCLKEEPAEVIPKLKDYIGHVHVADIATTREPVYLGLGEGAIDFPKVIQSIRDIGYDAFLTIALEPAPENASTAAEKSLAYLRSLLA